jgi:hypothetical protein
MLDFRACRNTVKMLVLEGEQGSGAIAAIERALLDYAYSGHVGVVAPSSDAGSRAPTVRLRFR